MLFSILSGGDIRDIIVELLLSLPVIIFALTVHETAHGFVAWKCGDNTAYNLGRLTLNPLKHLDPIGFLSMLIFGYGWAKPVPINTRNFRNPKRGMALSAAAGPAANLLLGAISAVLYGFCVAWYNYLSYTIDNAFFLQCVEVMINLFMLGALYNFLFMAFNLIPVPPFDGSRVAFVFLPPKAYFGLMRYERQIMIGVLVALMILSRLGFSPFSWIAEKLTVWIASPVADGFWSIFQNALLNSLS
ncbi:MAG: site-2 protease family protein [Clostridia bacterium]|nr:site-2 protease family protein [Clostridia bacterium]